MNHDDHVHLISKGIISPSGSWADFGSGSGAFTLALAELLDDSATLYSVDKDRWALRRQRQSMLKRFPRTEVMTIHADYTKPIELPPLDGMLLANTLHFHAPQRRIQLMQRLLSYLKPNGRFILIEYNSNRGNRWVPHPFTFNEWHKLAERAGLVNTQLLATRPSSFLGEIYSAVSVAP